MLGLRGRAGKVKEVTPEQREEIIRHTTHDLLSHACGLKKSVKTANSLHPKYSDLILNVLGIVAISTVSPIFPYIAAADRASIRRRRPAARPAKASVVRAR